MSSVIIATSCQSSLNVSSTEYDVCSAVSTPSSVTFLKFRVNASPSPIVLEAFCQTTTNSPSFVPILSVKLPSLNLAPFVTDTGLTSVES